MTVLLVYLGYIFIVICKGADLEICHGDYLRTAHCLFFFCLGIKNSKKYSMLHAFQRCRTCANVSRCQLKNAYINVTDVIKEITPSHLNIEPVFSDNVATDYF